MDSDRFDSLVRRLVAGSSRRRVLGGLVPGLLVFAPAVLGLDVLAARQKHGKKKRNKKKKGNNAGGAPCKTAAQCPSPRKRCLVAICKNGRCGQAVVANGSEPGNPCDDGLFCNGLERCGANGDCQGGTPPICDDGVTCTRDLCDDILGGCLHTPDDDLCGDDQTCHQSEGCQCLGTLTRCGPQCFLPGAACDTGQSGRCAEGTVQCVNAEVRCVRTNDPIAETCNGIDDDCDGEVDEGNDLCPARDHSTGICTAGECGYSCDTGFQDCDGNPINGCETNVLSNLNHCGECNRPCLARPNTISRDCFAGQCGYLCIAGYADCDGNPDTPCDTLILGSDSDHCGACNSPCTGSCGSAANPGINQCVDGLCICTIEI